MGDGKSFCAGLDLKIVPSFGEADQKRLLNALNRAFYSVYSCPAPVIGAINGHAIAGGLVLAPACDWRIGADRSFRAGLTEVVVGIPYPVAAIEIALQELSPRVARDPILFGENITARLALECGVLDEWRRHFDSAIRTGSLANVVAARHSTRHVRGCLGYVDFRYPEANWPSRFPETAAWHQRTLRRPSMADTKPENPSSVSS